MSSLPSPRRSSRPSPTTPARLVPPTDRGISTRLARAVLPAAAVLLAGICVGCASGKGSGSARTPSAGAITPAASTKATSPRSAASAATIRPADLDLLLGEPMRGTLTYLDYTSGRTQIIRSTLQVARKADAENTWEVKIGYNDEPEKASAEALALSADGRKLNKETVVERNELPGGAVRILTTEQGTDDSRPATIQYVYTLAPKSCTLEKLVCFTGQNAYFQRNIYRWSR